MLKLEKILSLNSMNPGSQDRRKKLKSLMMNQKFKNIVMQNNTIKWSAKIQF